MVWAGGLAAADRSAQIVGGLERGRFSSGFCDFGGEQLTPTHDLGMRSAVGGPAVQIMGMGVSYSRQFFPLGQAQSMGQLLGEPVASSSEFVVAVDVNNKSVEFFGQASSTTLNGHEHEHRGGPDTGPADPPPPSTSTYFLVFHRNEVYVLRAPPQYVHLVPVKYQGRRYTYQRGGSARPVFDPPLVLVFVSIQGR